MTTQSMISEWHVSLINNQMHYGKGKQNSNKLVERLILRVHFFRIRVHFKEKEMYKMFSSDQVSGAQISTEKHVQLSLITFITS
jgi:hypothetical protein